MDFETDHRGARSAPRTGGRLARLALAALLLLPGLTGCGGGTGTDAGGALNAAGNGEVVIGLTDADGDFLTYEVDVLSLKLTRADATTVETLPLATRVDFAQYADLTEFLTAASVPLGNYTSATLRLDFTDAFVEVEVSGVPVRAKVELSDGSTPGILDVTVNLSNDRPLKVKRGLPSQLVLDFDLAASNQVDLGVDPPLVTVEPFLLASVNPADAKPHRLRGLLKKVNVDAHLFHIRVRPFRHLLAANDGFGVFPVKTDADTVFEVDGEPYVGDEGLKALAQLPVGAPVVAIGDVNRARRHMHARQVRAGTSVPWGDRDAVTGVVTAREGDTLTVRGAVLTFRHGVHLFRDELEVLVGENTKVTRLDVEPGVLDQDAISVGQRITALGDLHPVVVDTAAVSDVQAKADLEAMVLAEPIPYPDIPPLVLDATEGHVRLLLSSLSGEVVEVGPGTLVVDVRALNGRSVDLYDFTGTGGTEDADPTAYEIDTGDLLLDFVMAGDPVQVRGFVTPWMTAPPDFMARTVVEPALTIDGAALLEMSWDPPSGTPFSEVLPEAVTLDLTGAGERHHLVQRWRITDLLTLPAAPVIEPPEGGAGSYAIRLDESLHVYFTFAGFAEAVEGFLADGQAASRLVAHGEWDADRNTLVSKALALRMGTVTTDAEL
jgi:hypothetical protein